jgi:hypothetical protein
MIETKSRSCEGWFPSGDTEEWSLWNHPRGIRFAIPVPTSLVGCALSGLHSLRS